MSATKQCFAKLDRAALHPCDQANRDAIFGDTIYIL
jgi:hypothetical protein